VAQIIAAIDGPIALTQCVDRSAEICTVETLCPSRAGWHKINEAVERALSEVSLAELMGTPTMFTENALRNRETTGSV
jgi:DNA-binding IscR family transcriptional regulator